MRTPSSTAAGENFETIGFRVRGFRVRGLRFRVQGSGFRVVVIFRYTLTLYTQRVGFKGASGLGGAFYAAPRNTVWGALYYDCSTAYPKALF